MIECVVAQARHIDGILVLQAENLVANMPADKKSGGFVTTPFTEALLRPLIEKNTVFVAVDMHHGAELPEVVGYLICGSWAFYSQWPVFAYMVSLFSEFTYQDTEMTTENSYQYGPVCISKAVRGSGAFERLFAFARTQMHKKYPYALTFINKQNTRSLEAHKKKTDIDVIREFSYDGQEYYFIGFATAVA